jgi:hypothetical protein
MSRARVATAVVMGRSVMTSARRARIVMASRKFRALRPSPDPGGGRWPPLRPAESQGGVSRPLAFVSGPMQMCRLGS